jgi:transposase
MNEMITISVSEYTAYKLLQEENRLLREEISSLRKLVQQLGEEIALLKQGRDSNTSSTPPSHDMGRSNGNSLRTKSGKATGVQAGHRGHHLPMVSTPDEVVAHVPEICSSTRHQVIDIPNPQPVCTEHRSYSKTGPCCGRENRGVYPEAVKAPVQWREYKKRRCIPVGLSVYTL